MKRYLSLYLPFWSTSILEQGWCTHQHHVPYILYHPAKTSEQIVARVCRCALQAGVHFDTTVSMGQVLLPQAQTLPFDDYKDFRLLYKVALWATRFTPLVALDSELVKAFQNHSLYRLHPHYTGMVLDITGTEKLHGSEQRLALSLFRRFSRRNMEVRIAIAPSIGSAWALSRFADKNISIIDTNEQDVLNIALNPLPIQALRLHEQTCLALKQLGLVRIEQTLQLPRAQITKRFPDLLLRLDQAFGRCGETLSFIHPQEPFHAGQQFEIPLTSQEALARVVFALLQQVMTHLQARGHKASSFLVELVCLSEERIPYAVRKEFTLFASTDSSSHVRALMQPFLESTYTPHGVCAVHVHAQVHRGNSATTITPIADVMNHFVTRLGKENVLRVNFRESHLPERSFSYQAITSSAATDITPQEQPIAHRPSYLFPEPEQITAIALLPDRAPSWVQWRGKKLPIKQGHGPERIGDEWWHHTVRLGSEPNARDYFRVEDESGRWLWIFRNQQSMRWYLHGLWL